MKKLQKLKTYLTTKPVIYAKLYTIIKWMTNQLK